MRKMYLKKTVLILAFLFLGWSVMATVHTVTQNTDDGTGATSGSLSWAINAATDGDIVVFNLISGDVITLSAALPVIDNSLTMDGINTATGNPVTIQVTNPGISTYRVFYINATGKTITLNDLIMRGGDVSGYTLPNYNGGVINMTGFGTTITMNHCVVKEGKAYSGGGICTEMSTNLAPTLNLNNCTVNNNTAIGSGGGCFTAQCTILNSTITGNNANNGGGIFENRTGKKLQIINTTISGNSAIQRGGGIYNFVSTNRGYVYLLNSIVINNTSALGIGADIYSNDYCYSYFTWTSYPSVITQNCISTAYTPGDLGALADNGGPTQTMELSSSAPAYQTGAYAYYNATDGYYFKGTDNNYYKLATGTTLTPSNPETDKITTDQRGETRSDPPSMGSYDGMLSNPMQLVFTTTADNQNIELPLNGTVNCTVDWGDGSATEDFTTTGLKPHTFATAGTYTVNISGSLTHFGKTDASTWPGAVYLTEVLSFGDIGLTSLQSAFYDADNLTSVPASLPATVTDLSYSFHSISQTAITNLSSWDVSNVTTMADMFHGANAFNQDISGWDVSNVENMKGMFDKAELFNANIGTWNVSSVSNMANMFAGAESFNQNIGNWNVSNVENMMLMFGFDDGAVSNFNQDISTKIVNAGQPNQYTAWDVSGVTNMAGMFAGNQSFNQDISNWDVESVVNMMWMFYYATAFDQNIGNWDITSVTDMSDMFTDGGLSTANYDAILTGWAGKTLQEEVVFSAGATKYSAGAPASARQHIISTYNWTITDGGINSLTYTWNGSSNSDWNTAANWNLNAVPTADAEVVIANAGTAPIITSSNQITCASLTVNPGASLTINDRGSLITNTATGTVTVKRMLSGSSQYHFLSSPVNNANLATVFEAGVQNEVYIRRFDEPSGNWVNLEIPANLTNGIGYSYIRQSKATATTATFTGSLITSDVTPSLTNNGTGGINYAGWNLIGNPYTSAIQWETGIWSRNNVDNAVYVWSNGVYKSFVNGAGTLTNGIIPAQQGFFVKANAASPSITIPADARVHNTQSFYKNSIPNVLRLDVASNVNEYIDGTFIRFTPEATPLFDSKFDAYKLNNDSEAPMIYTHAGDASLSINSLPAIQDYSEIIVSFTAGVDGRYSITASGMETFANSNITLTDQVTNATQNLAQNPVYSFDATTFDQPDRFKVSFATVGVDENPLQNIGVYAANGQIVLQLPQATKAQVTLINLAGQLVAKHDINAMGVASLDAPATTGVYMITITTETGTITRKVIVK